MNKLARGGYDSPTVGWEVCLWCSVCHHHKEVQRGLIVPTPVGGIQEEARQLGITGVILVEQSHLPELDRTTRVLIRADAQKGRRMDYTRVINWTDSGHLWVTEPRHG